MSGWSHLAICDDHGTDRCDCAKDRVWELRDDSNRLLGTVEQFNSDDSPYYGSAAGGRTDAMTTLPACQARVEKMLEQPR